ncbi:MAG: hypothetical protein KDK78_03735, partial [Chlamydiia bacterium]|nr:hypothetical protein [Chlamydiia bacterium]
CREPLSNDPRPYPDFFREDERKVARAFTEKVRDNLLLPALKQSLLVDKDSQKSLYLMGLLYASHDNKLGELVSGNVTAWAIRSGLPASLLHSYVGMAEHPWSEELSQDSLKAVDTLAPRSQVEDWEAFFKDLKSLSQEEVITRNVLKSVQDGASKLLEASSRLEKDELTDQILVGLESVPHSNVHALFDPHLQVLEWVDANRSEIKGLLTLVQETQERRFPVSQFDLAQLALELEKLAKANAEPESGRDFTISYRDHVETYRGKEWKDTVANSTVTWLLDEFLADKKGPRPDLLFPKTESNLPRLAWSGNTDGSPLFLGSAQVDGRYTKKAYDGYVAPTILRLSMALEQVPMAEKDKARIEGFLTQTVDAYATAYRDAYREMYTAYGTQADSENRLKVLLMQMQNPKECPLDDLLQMVSVNTDFTSETNPILRRMQDRTREFGFTHRLSRRDGGKWTGAAPFMDIIHNMEGDLLGRRAPSRKQDPIEEGLSAVGRLSYSIVREDPDSYWKQVTAWLDREGVPEYYREPFMEPLHRLLDVGLADLSGTIEKTWENRLRPSVAPLFQKFPFNPGSSSEVTVAELTKVLGPDSQFWKDVAAFTQPFCASHGRCQDSIDVKGHSLELPGQMACVLQSLTTIRDSLWDDKGQPRPLMVSVRPVDSKAQSKPLDSESFGYLSAGTNAIYAFSDTPGWHELSLEWWKSEGATVGMTVVDNIGQSKSHRRMDVPRSPFSFLRLLQQASSHDGSVWTWELPEEQSAGARTSQELPFEVQGRMLELFESDCLKKESR